ncbi:MAG: arginine--tRNA ligase [Pseudomonadota bacterium]
MSIIDVLSSIVGDAFAAEGLNSALGRVVFSDRPDLAQFQCNGALAAAKAAKKNPREIGAAVAARLEADKRFEKVALAGPGFINLTATDAFLTEEIRAIAGDGRLGGWRNQEPETIVLDYGGPNVAKPLHVGHVRTAVLGESLKRLMRFCGDQVTGDIHLGDWGLPMGQLISEIARERPDLPYFDESFEGPYPEEAPVTLEDLERLYPQASAACKADKARLEEARLATAQLQAGRPGYRALWRHFIDVSHAALAREYGDLGVTFDLWKGESDVDHLIAPMAEELRAKGIVEKSDGAQIIQVARPDDKKETPPLILFKSDGSVLYGTTDLATILDRVRTIAPTRMLYVVDQRQALHFEQVFRAADKAGYFDADRLEHLGFGTINGPDGKPFKTRDGGVLRLRALIDQVRERALERMAEAHIAEGYSEEERTDIANKIGLAALKFGDLSNVRTSDYIFDIDRFVAFEGKTGPYLQYAAVRIKSILRKADEAPNAAAITLAAPAERDLALAMLAFAPAVRSAYEKRQPHILCDFVFNLAQSFSKFYAAHHILSEEDAHLRASRLALAAAAGRQIELTLDLLGVETPERM